VASHAHSESLLPSLKTNRRRYDEIERMYSCGWNGCEKAYGTLNHLNAHVTMQEHGSKRTPEEFKELRRAFKEQKRKELAARKDIPEAASSQSARHLSAFQGFNSPYMESHAWTSGPRDSLQHQVGAQQMYKCGWQGCEKAYNTLSHLNAHLALQSHGPHRASDDFGISSAPIGLPSASGEVGIRSHLDIALEMQAYGTRHGPEDFNHTAGERPSWGM
jgi:hypothetical protein